MTTAQSTSNARTTVDLAGTLVGRWDLDPQRSEVKFRVPSIWGLVTVKGHFETFRGRLDLSAEPAIYLTIEAASVQTRNRRRDAHLRSATFFDAENHPMVRFVSDQVVVVGSALQIHGRLFARGASVPLELEAQMGSHHDNELTIDAATRVRHRELGMTFSPLGSVGAESDLQVSARLIRRPQPDALRA
jgi:polyisoprenoid-binding protein YceI